MKLKNLFFTLSLLIAFGCTENQDKNKPTIEEEIKALASIEDKKQYLEDIFQTDQKVRGSHGQEIVIKFGKDSEEYSAYLQTQINQDALNLNKVEKYLAIYGHPKKREVGEIAAQTPWAVIHHASSYEERERNFAYLYRGYLNEDIDDGTFSMYLGRMYEMKNGERFNMESPFRSEDEINQLIKELNLEEVKAKVQ